MRSMARAAPHAPHAAHIVHAAHAAAGDGGGGDVGGCSGGGGGGGGCSCPCCCCCPCGCYRSSAFSSSFCHSRLYPLPLKHVAASTAARFNFSFADGCFNAWSPSSPTCPCAIQLTSGERPVYDSTFSSSLSSRSAGKNRFAVGKNHRNGKKHVWQQEKNALQREKAVSAAGKNASKKCRFAAGKIQSSRKNTLQQHKSTFAAEKMHFGGSEKKPSEAGKNPSEARKKAAEAGKKPAAEKVQLCNPKSCRNGKNTFPQWEKAAAREPGCIGIPNPGGCISAPELPPPWIILLASYA